MEVLPSKHNGCAVMHMQVGRRMPLSHLPQLEVVDVLVGRNRTARKVFTNRFFFGGKVCSTPRKSAVLAQLSSVSESVRFWTLRSRETKTEAQSELDLWQRPMKSALQIRSS
jgi:hypothetical protein